MQVPLNATVTVFGGTGFIGRQIVRSLARDGWRVRVATRNPSQALSLKPLGEVGQIAFVRADIRDERAVAAAVEGAVAVVNCVGILRPGSGRTFDEMHVAGPTNISAAAARAGVARLLHISSLGAAERASSAYARSKARGEKAVRAAFPGAVVLRPAIVFGPEDGFLNRFAAMMRISPVFPLFGSGRTRFQPVFVGDVADAAATALKDPAAAGRTFELAGPAVYTFRELMTWIARETGRRTIFVNVPFFLLDIAAALTGWLPFAPITLDQARLLRVDNVPAGEPGLSALGVHPTALEAVAPSYLYRFRPAGQFTVERRL